MFDDWLLRVATELVSVEPRLDVGLWRTSILLVFFGEVFYQRWRRGGREEVGNGVNFWQHGVSFCLSLYVFGCETGGRLESL